MNKNERSFSLLKHYEDHLLLNTIIYGMYWILVRFRIKGLSYHDHYCFEYWQNRVKLWSNDFLQDVSRAIDLYEGNLLNRLINF